MTCFLRRLGYEVRRHLCLNGSTRYRIEYVDGFDPPEVLYAPVSYHYETAGGRLVRHPSSYRANFGRPVYCPASRRIIRVGKGWAIEHAM